MAIVAGPSSGGTTSMSGTLVTTSRPSSATSLPDQITTSSSVQTNPAQATVGSQGNLAANSTKSHSLSTGAAAGIAFGVILFITLLAAGAYLFWKRHKIAKVEKYIQPIELDGTEKPAELEGSPAASELWTKQIVTRGIGGGQADAEKKGLENIWGGIAITRSPTGRAELPG